MSRTFAQVLVVGLLSGSLLYAADEPLFSGPQAGEKLVPFKVQGVFDLQAGKELDFVAAAEGKPLLLIFMHDLTRPSAGLTRALCAYMQPMAAKAHCSVVWLTADRSQTEAYLKRARSSLNLTVPVGISVDGIEGPGSYGLHRKVALTVLVAKDNQVTANFALVQPAMTDAPKILAEVAKVTGDKPPTLEDIQELLAPPAARIRKVLGTVLRLQATEEEVQRAAAAVDRLVAADPKLQRELGSAAQQIVQGGKLQEHGTPAGQEHVRRWAEKYGPK